MSRLAKIPLVIPEGVEAKIIDGGAGIFVKGPLGEMKKNFPPAVKIEIKDGKIYFKRMEETNFAKAMHGTMASIVRSMVKGVKDGFEKKLQIIGLGYQFTQKGQEIVISCGYSDDVHYLLPPEIKAKAEKTNLTLISHDKELLGRTASQIRAVRPPEPYKGKGIHYVNEVIRRKAGKKAVAASGGGAGASAA